MCPALELVQRAVPLEVGSARLRPSSEIGERGLFWSLPCEACFLCPPAYPRAWKLAIAWPENSAASSGADANA